MISKVLKDKLSILYTLLLTIFTVLITILLKRKRFRESYFFNIILKKLFWKIYLVPKLIRIMMKYLLVKNIIYYYYILFIEKIYIIN